MGEDGMPADDEASVIMAERRQLTNLAYRLLGSLTEAEDAVQEGFARWFAMPSPERETIRSPGAWLTTVTGRICLDMLGSARARRERYVGEWVPEPLPEALDWVSLGDPSGRAGSDPADQVTLDESVTMAFLVTLESMTPAERVALILHDVFGYAFPEVATIVGRTPAACRQLASSARRRARSFESPTPTPDRRSDVVRAFKSAWEARDVAALIRVLDTDATAIADAGGRLPHATLAPIVGVDGIVSHYLSVIERLPLDMTVVECLVNGQLGLAVQQDGHISTVLAFDVAGDRIRRIWAVLNPDKLTPWTGQPRPRHR